jgi:hypothetical protein
LTLAGGLAKHVVVEEHRGRPVFVAVFAGGLVCFTFVASSTCGASHEQAAVPDAGRAEAAALTSANQGGAGATAAGLSAPIAAARLAGGDVVVAALDAAAHAVRLQRITPDDTVAIDRSVLDDVTWSSDAELKAFVAGDGVAVTWRGQRGGKAVRLLVRTGPDLAPRGAPIEVSAGACVTQDAFFSTDGRHVTARPWSGEPSRVDLPKEEDASLVCGAHRAFVVLEEEEKTSLVVVGDHGHDRPRASEAADGGLVAEPRVVLVEESAFGDDDQRERAEYTVGDDLGIVRLGATGSLAMRELKGGVLGPMHRMKTTIPREDDVVTVDASPRFTVVVYTQDVSEACPEGEGSTKVVALRIDRATHEEATFELSPGACGREVGPFFTGAIGDAVSVGWVERTSVRSKEKAPITGLVHRLVGPDGAARELARIDQPADALVDAGCDDKRCYAVALARRPGADVMAPGFARVLRYP